MSEKIGPIMFGTEQEEVFLGRDFAHSKEYSEDWTLDKEPYYPVNDSVNQDKYKKYADEASKYQNVIFGGRLAEYKYYDMDKVIASALKAAEKEGLINE